MTNLIYLKVFSCSKSRVDIRYKKVKISEIKYFYLLAARSVAVRGERERRTNGNKQEREIVRRLTFLPVRPAMSAPG